MSQDCTSTSVLQNKHVDTFVYDQEAIDIARDCVKGSLEHYYFFQFDSDEYVLIMADDIQTIDNSFHFSAFDCTVYVFYKEVTTVNNKNNIKLDGTIGSIGTNTSVEDVLLAGTVDNKIDTVTWQIHTFPSETAHIYNTDYLAYGDYGNLPRLVEGVSYYAYAAFALCLGIIGFRLLDRIFRRIY